jgi:hypothetical protein
MRFHFNKVSITEPNDRGWMACVWQDSQRARLYNLYPDDYPEYAGYSNVPEIRISVSPDNGISWSDPIVLNNQINNPLNGVKPMWVYPADQIEYLGPGENGTFRGRLYLLFLNDHTWGYSSMWTDYGGITYMAVDITFPGVGVEDATAVPQPVALAQNNPNPFHSTTTISYTLDKAARIELSIYNIKGQLVKTLVDSPLSKGNHQTSWDGTDDHGHKVAAGIYPFKISNGKFTTSKKMILLK